jgi:hypothetical protein
MPTPIHLTIQEPCHETWQQMTPNEQGRHCMSCQKTVVDFSLMNDREILQYISTASHHVCGRFSDDQLDKTYREQKPRRSFSWRYAWNMLVATFLVTGSVEAQQQEGPKRTFVTKQPDKAPAEIVLRLGKIAKLPVDVNIDGVVVDDSTGRPAAKVLDTVVVKGYRNICRKAMMGGLTMVRVSTITEKATREMNEWLPKKDVRIYPNPVMPGNTVNVSISLKEMGAYRMELLDGSGRLVHVQALQVNQPTQTVSLPTQSSWGRGVYWLRIANGSAKKVYQAKVLLQ